MTWVEIAWTMMAAASLTLGFIHLSVWSVQRSRYAFLVLFFLAASVTAFSVFEMLAMRAQSPADYAVVSRWCHVPLAVILLAMLAFIRMYLGTGALWLAYGAGALRLLALALNFSTGTTVITTAGRSGRIAGRGGRRSVQFEVPVSRSQAEGTEVDV